LKKIFRIDPVAEAAAFAASHRRHVDPLERRTLVVTNPKLAGLTIDNIPGLPQPVRLGLAGGPLIVALLLGRIGTLVFHMPVNTNLAFRELGIALFFAAVGLGAGAKSFTTVFSAVGLQWLLAGMAVTLVPLLAVGIFARVVWKMSFMDLSGLIAGSMTDPPALAFATNVSGSDAPTVACTTVYPLTTLLRILSAQVLAIVLLG
jgi:putative transport protein